LSGVQDWDLALRIAEKGKLHYVPKPLYRHRIHPLSVTRSDHIAQFRKSNQLRRRALERWLRAQSPYEAADNDLRTVHVNIPIDIRLLKAGWAAGQRYVANLLGNPLRTQIDFLRDSNSYFERIVWTDPTVPASLAGYLWSPLLLVGPETRPPREAGMCNVTSVPVMAFGPVLSARRPDHERQ
jgi:hypothetical protein